MWERFWKEWKNLIFFLNHFATALTYHYRAILSTFLERMNTLNIFFSNHVSTALITNPKKIVSPFLETRKIFVQNTILHLWLMLLEQFWVNFWKEENFEYFSSKTFSTVWSNCPRAIMSLFSKRRKIFNIFLQVIFPLA